MSKYRLNFTKLAPAEPQYVDVTNIRVELRAAIARAQRVDYMLSDTLYTYETLESILRHADCPFALDAIRESAQAQATCQSAS